MSAPDVVLAGPVGRAGPARPGPAAVAATAVLLVAVLGALLGPLLAPHDPNAVDLGASLAGPSGTHPLGADQQGRDVLSRLLHGARSSLLAPLVIVAVSTALGTAVGLLAGWRRGLVDAALSRALEVALAFPGVLLALVVVARTGPGAVGPVVAIALWLTPYVARQVRTATIEEVARPYVDAYRTTGWGPLAIALRGVLPNVAGLLLARAAVNAGIALVALASLSYLGLGVQPPDADWGAMIHEGLDALQAGDAWPALVPAAALVAVVLAVNVLGDALAARVGREED
ncbi:ABC transporter permease [Patulibacter sp. SYSU D01012]|uniref:ABC transporter permease n=1 Tax=Patulibacter sp. SYSU D01012 TaxID=2817381 RepID=UPI001B30D41C